MHGAHNHQISSPSIHGLLSKRPEFGLVILSAANSYGRLQIVILGAGLDTRAWRLELGERVSIYEVDQPDMSTAKGHCLRAGNAQTSRAQTGSCQFPLKCGSWIAVAADLTQDWKTALQDKGFDKGEPHAWHRIFYSHEQVTGRPAGIFPYVLRCQ